MAWWRMALKGTRLGDKRPEKRVGEGLPYREGKDRWGFPF